MSKNTDALLHKKSSAIINGNPKLPSSDVLREGEIAINFAEGYETISIKNSEGTVVPFSSDEYYTVKKLGSGFTGSNSATTVTDILNSLEVGEEVEVNSGDTPTGDTIELWIDESIEPVTVEVYTKSETNSLLDNKLNVSDFNTYSGAVDTTISSKSDKTSTVSNVLYNDTTGKLQQTINGTTTDVVSVVNSGFKFELNNGILNLIPIGTATAVVEDGILKLTF